MLAYEEYDEEEEDCGERIDPRLLWRATTARQVEHNRTWDVIGHEPPTARLDLPRLRTGMEEVVAGMLGNLRELLIKPTATAIPKTQEAEFPITVLQAGFSHVGVGETRSIAWPTVGDMDGLLDLIDAFEPVEVTSKETAPCFVPCTFKSGTRTRGSADAYSGTALVFDFDRGNVDMFDLRLAIESLGLAALLWSTWQSGGATGRRWRVVVPLAAPVATESAYDTLWKRVARRLVDAVAREAGIAQPWDVVGDNGKRGLIDWDPSLVKPAILPCYPASGTGSARYPWGGIKPEVEVVEGALLKAGGAIKPKTKAPAKVTTPKVQLLKAFHAVVPVFVPNADAEHVPETIARLACHAEGGTPMPLAALDAVARLRRDGVRQRAGSRHDTVSGAAWTLYRTGSTSKEIGTAITEIVEATASDRDRTYLQRECRPLAGRFGRQCEESQVFEDRIVRECRDRIKAEHRTAFRAYARILSRAEHLRRDEGGALCHESIAKIIGLDVKVLTAMRAVVRDAGYLTEAGEGKRRTYRILPP